MVEQAGFTVHSIFLTSSSHNRLLTINVDDENYPFDLNLKVENKIEEDILECSLTAEIIRSFGKRNRKIKSVFTYSGIFEKTGDSQLSIKDFSLINAPAMLYPYIREHVSNLSLRSGIPIAPIPPVNFEKFAEDVGGTLVKKEKKRVVKAKKTKKVRSQKT